VFQNAQRFIPPPLCGIKMNQERQNMKSKDNFFLDIENIKRLDTFRIIYSVMFMLSFGITEIGRYIYRPFIYENDINDFGIADSMGNLGGIIVQIFFGLTVFNPSHKKGLRLISFFIIGYILYEIAQPFLPKGVFDWNDIYGTIIGGLIGLLLFHLIHKVVKQNKIIYRF
jgi:glycerol uptake facilitator-like aquaporin